MIGPLSLKVKLFDVGHDWKLSQNTKVKSPFIVVTCLIDGCCI
jgi:hypothetical protein